ncbi:MAG: hypothetical protein M3387_09450 [Actinomycetota bacterium]|nr:hypothetical protein [Actinomycetota bacterium]
MLTARLGGIVAQQRAGAVRSRQHLAIRWVLLESGNERKGTDGCSDGDRVGMAGGDSMVDGLLMHNLRHGDREWRVGQQPQETRPCQ